MSLVPVRHICPCCGFDDLRGPAYARLTLPVPTELKPPYVLYFGDPSYEVCGACGFEFGNDDDPGTAEGVSFETYRAEWIAAGAVWFTPSRRPADWSLDRQLANLGLAA